MESAWRRSGTSDRNGREADCNGRDKQLRSRVRAASLYLTANAIPKARWVPITKSLVDDKIYKSLNCLGRECTYGTLKSHLRRRFGKDDSLFVQRLQFFQRVQKPGESVDDFADELRCLGAEVGKQDDDLKEQFIMGLQDTAAQRHLLDKRPDSFDQAVQIAKQYRAAQASVENMQKRRRLMMTGGCQDGYATEGSGPSRTEKQPIVTALERIEERLSRLEVAHQGDECRIRRKSHGEGTAIREAARRKAEVTCFVCATTGHFARDCPLRQRERNAMEDSAMSLTDGSLSRESRRLPYVEVEFSNGMRVNALVDTGAVATFLHESLLEQCGIPMQPWKQAGFTGVDGAQVCPKGQAKLELTCLGRRLSVNAVVLAAPPCPLALGMDALTSLGVTLELSAQGPLVQLVNDRQPRDKEILPTRAESWTIVEPITSVTAGVTYGEQLNGVQRAEA
ncbi:hypothetical protein M513_11875 [Trichuris suis]|uniref:CCHC-type domain-containing protein n=1 Tax=Trichuris suis TaxID=68888 RepID=A0A085LQM9_9BILA|nr:hypothetical protein M513_11875 [Trichuris suis]